MFEQKEITKRAKIAPIYVRCWTMASCVSRQCLATAGGHLIRECKGIDWRSRLSDSESDF